MANLIMYCNACSKRAKQHEKYAICSLCSLPTHINCLPIYLDEDTSYATNQNGHWTCPTCLENHFPFFSLGNDDVSHQLTIEYSQNMHDLDSLNDMIFHPFELNDMDMDHTDDLDPDSNYFNPIMNQNLTSCKYYNFDQLNQETSKHTQNHFSQFCLNIRSLSKNYRKLITLLDTIDTKFSIITLSETWLKEYNQDIYEIEGYEHISQLRENKAGGGVSIYVKNNINFKIRNDLSCNNHDHQLLWVELDKLDLDSDTNIIIGAIYRRPGSDISSFIDVLSNSLSNIKNEEKKVPS